MPTPHHPDPSASGSSAPDGVGDALARPKVMRRPAQFATRTVVPALTPPPRPAAAPSAPTSTRSWQDDPRFAVALLTLVVLFNLLMAYGLGQSDHPSADATRVPPVHTSSTGEEAPSTDTVATTPRNRDEDRLDPLAAMQPPVHLLDANPSESSQ